MQGSFSSWFYQQYSRSVQHTGSYGDLDKRQKKIKNLVGWFGEYSEGEKEREKGADWIGLKQGWQVIVTWPWSDIVALTYLSSVIRRITRQKKNMVNIGPNDNNCLLGHCIPHDSPTLKNDIKSFCVQQHFTKHKKMEGKKRFQSQVMFYRL